MIAYHWTSGIIAFVLAGTIIWLVRNNRLQARTAAGWMVLALIIAATGLFPGMVDFAARVLGIHYPPTLAMLCGFAVLLVKLVKNDIERSRSQQQIRILAQKVSHLEAQLDDRNNERRDTDSG